MSTSPRPVRRVQQATATPDSTTTQTISAISQPDLVLRLRGAHEPSTSSTRRIQWAEDVVDNEGLGRKKSKVCCIYHKTRDFGESSSEEDSSSDEDSESDDGRARRVGGRNSKNHHHRDGCGHGKDKDTKRKPSPNAYERMPKYDVKPLEKQPGK